MIPTRHTSGRLQESDYDLIEGMENQDPNMPPKTSKGLNKMKKCLTMNNMLINLTPERETKEDDLSIIYEKEPNEYIKDEDGLLKNSYQEISETKFKLNDGS